MSIDRTPSTVLCPGCVYWWVRHGSGSWPAEVGCLIDTEKELVRVLLKRQKQSMCWAVKKGSPRKGHLDLALKNEHITFQEQRKEGRGGHRIAA